MKKITCFFAPVSIASQCRSVEDKQAEINTPERDDDQPPAQLSVGASTSYTHRILLYSSSNMQEDSYTPRRGFKSNRMWETKWPWHTRACTALCVSSIMHVLTACLG